MSQDTSAARKKPNELVRTAPIIGWLPKCQKSCFAPDLLAGLSVWALVIPQALAHANVVGVPARYGLYTIPRRLGAVRGLRLDAPGRQGTIGFCGNLRRGALMRRVASFVA